MTAIKLTSEQHSQCRNLLQSAFEKNEICHINFPTCKLGSLIKGFAFLEANQTAAFVDGVGTLLFVGLDNAVTAQLEPVPNFVSLGLERLRGIHNAGFMCELLYVTRRNPPASLYSNAELRSFTELWIERLRRCLLLQDFRNLTIDNQARGFTKLHRDYIEKLIGEAFENYNKKLEQGQYRE